MGSSASPIQASLRPPIWLLGSLLTSLLCQPLLICHPFKCSLPPCPPPIPVSSCLGIHLWTMTVMETPAPGSQTVFLSGYLLLCRAMEAYCLTLNTTIEPCCPGFSSQPLLGTATVRSKDGDHFRLQASPKELLSFMAFGKRRIPPYLAGGHRWRADGAPAPTHTPGIAAHEPGRSTTDQATHEPGSLSRPHSQHY